MTGFTAHCYRVMGLGPFDYNFAAIECSNTEPIRIFFALFLSLGGSFTIFFCRIEVPLH